VLVVSCDEHERKATPLHQPRNAGLNPWGSLIVSKLGRCSARFHIASPCCPATLVLQLVGIEEPRVRGDKARKACEKSTDDKDDLQLLVMPPCKLFIISLLSDRDKPSSFDRIKRLPALRAVFAMFMPTTTICRNSNRGSDVTDSRS
jgi:hypothetical protein